MHASRKLTFLCPFPQHLVRRPQFAFLDDLSVGGLHAVTDALLVNVESDIVFDVHWVLPFEVSEPVRKNRSRHCTLRGNPTYLYIQTANPDSRPPLLVKLTGDRTEGGGHRGSGRV